MGGTGQLSITEPAGVYARSDPPVLREEHCGRKGVESTPMHQGSHDSDWLNFFRAVCNLSEPFLFCELRVRKTLLSDDS